MGGDGESSDSLEYGAKIDGNQPIQMELPVGNSGLDLEGDEEEGTEGDGDKDVPAELVRECYWST